MIAAIVVLGLLALWLLITGITRYGFRQVTQMRLYRYPDENLAEYLLRTGVFTKEKYESMASREIQTTSIDGLRLNAQLFLPYPGSKKWAIIAHGYTMSLRSSLQFGALFEEKGFNLLLIDHRRHGKSQGRYTTYGFREKHDLEAWVNWLLEQYGRDIQIGLHGQSLGGATVLEYLSMADPAVKFAVVDCPYSDLNKLIHYQLTRIIRLPSFPFIRLLNRELQSKAGFRLEQVSPIRSVMQSRLPVLFIHGSADRYVPPSMSQEMFEAKPGPKRLVLIPGATHATSYQKDPRRYKEELQSFIDECFAEEEQPAEPKAALWKMRAPQLGGINSPS
ncbi:alpha/beta hydrolase [Paenibacillus physcomitrellae]|uniref:Exported protein n=1 Tax=Paenibacillus physcomitrellae TaxID=1619311 RepID=A0ABQ1FWG6_9BACL|nr:alpha/beta hydrolase [Paenibacillus physcomitrellae]GGA32630.1 exported protein [Paenibacillus physcomitrellae]